MKQFLMKLAARVDGWSLRERFLMFCAALAVIVGVASVALLGPLFARQDLLKSQISQNRNNIAGIDEEITKKVTAYAVDPDEANRQKLVALQDEVGKLGKRVRGMQETLVAPEKMASLLESMLKANARLRLTGMRTLPVQPLAEGAYTIPVPPPPVRPGFSVAPPPPPKSGNLLYRHGVELTVRGGYLDMVEYMSTLENMPAHLFWDNVSMNVEQYPEATLTLTVYTLSLDQKWIQL